VQAKPAKAATANQTNQQAGKSAQEPPGPPKCRSQAPYHAEGQEASGDQTAKGPTESDEREQNLGPPKCRSQAPYHAEGQGASGDQTADAAADTSTGKLQSRPSPPDPGEKQDPETNAKNKNLGQNLSNQTESEADALNTRIGEGTSSVPKAATIAGDPMTAG